MYLKQPTHLSSFGSCTTLKQLPAPGSVPVRTLFGGESTGGQCGPVGKAGGSVRPSRPYPRSGRKGCSRQCGSAVTHDGLPGHQGRHLGPSPAPFRAGRFGQDLSSEEEEWSSSCMSGKCSFSACVAAPKTRPSLTSTGLSRNFPGTIFRNRDVGIHPLAVSTHSHWRRLLTPRK